MNIRNILNRTATQFEEAGLTSPRLDAEVLLSSYLRTGRLELYKAPEKLLTEKEISGFARWRERRCLGEPVAYITGIKEFWSLSFEVNKDVLVPRPETEILVEETIKASGELAPAGLRILEIGVGSGAVSVALACELPDARLTATDISAGAVALALRNARTHAVEDRIAFLCGSFFEPVSGIFDIIISNPPYISAGEFEQLPREVREYEPGPALLAGKDGMACHREIIGGGIRRLKKGGWLLMEMGAGQSKGIEALLKGSDAYECIGIRRDYSGIERVIKARKK
jgi:release factor glutamine methyltransferase